MVLCSALDSFFSTTTSLTDSAFSSPLFSFSLSFSVDSGAFSTLGDFSFLFGDFSGVLDLDFDLRLVDVVSPSSSELDDEELEDDELEEEPGGATKRIENDILG